jgi:hypothetical protein
MTRLVITNGVQEGRVLRLRSGINRVGRSIENHLQVPDPSVSGAHCEIIFSDSEIFIRDLDSTNGTLIDGQPIREGSIRIGQWLQLGDIRMRVEAPALTSEDAGINVPELPPPSFAASAILPDGSLSCIDHPEVRAEYRCTVCQQSFCESCVRIIHRVSGGVLIFCPMCAGGCQSVAPPLPPRAHGLLDRLAQTIRLAFRKKPK